MTGSSPANLLKKVPKKALKQDVTLSTIEDMAQRLRNWGKWGPDDQLGTLNYVTPADIVKAAALVRKGKAFSLGLDFNQHGPQRTGWGRPLQSHPHDARDRYRRGCRPARSREAPLRRRHGLHAAAMRDPVGCARPHLLWRQDVEWL